MNKYEDIINFPHHNSKYYPRMSLENRSAQFAPFAALTGYSDAIKEMARLTENRIEMDDGLKQIINDKIFYVYNNKIKSNFTYFVPDKNKKGGKYIEKTGYIKKIDEIDKKIILNDKTTIFINEIINIKET